MSELARAADELLAEHPRRNHGETTFDAFVADAWFLGGGHERDVMALELLERDQLLATVMPGHGQPPPPGGGDEAAPETETEEPEGDPS